MKFSNSSLIHKLKGHLSRSNRPLLTLSLIFVKFNHVIKQLIRQLLLTASFNLLLKYNPLWTKLILSQHTKLLQLQTINTSSCHATIQMLCQQSVLKLKMNCLKIYLSYKKNQNCLELLKTLRYQVKLTWKSFCRVTSMKN